MPEDSSAMHPFDLPIEEWRAKQRVLLMLLPTNLLREVEPTIGECFVEVPAQDRESMERILRLRAHVLREAHRTQMDSFIEMCRSRVTRDFVASQLAGLPAEGDEIPSTRQLRPIWKAEQESLKSGTDDTKAANEIRLLASYLLWADRVAPPPPGRGRAR